MRYAVLVLAIPLLGGCLGWLSDDEGVFVNRSDDYIDAREGPDLLIPEDLGISLEDPFPIPQIPNQPNATFYPTRPPLPDAIYASDNRNEIRIQRLGARRWLVVPEPPEEVWPKMKQFLAENGVPVVSEVPGQGRITTAWLEVGDDEQYRDVIRTLLQDARGSASLSTGRDRIYLRLEQGLRQLTSEVHVRHANDSIRLPDADAVSMPSSSDLQDAEQAMLSELGAYIAARVAEQTVSMVAQEIASQEKAVLTRNRSGDPILRLYLDEERAWATLGSSLSNAEVEVIDQDRDNRTYYVKITEAVLAGEEKPGFFGRLFSFGGDKGMELLIRLNRAAAEEQVLVVLDPEGQTIEAELSQQILVLIREFAA